MKGVEEFLPKCVHFHVAKSTVLAYARTMTWKGLNPTVELVTNIYHSGVKLTQEAMHKIEKQIERLSGLETGFVDSHPSHNGWDT